MDSSRYRPNADVIAHPMGQEMILLHLETSRFFELNRTGARLWQLLASGCRRGELQERLAAEFQVDLDQLGREIDGLLAALVAEKLVSEHVDD
jgi:Coenzyme PQQ synthesis protein D (PqqD)